MQDTIPEIGARVVEAVAQPKTFELATATSIEALDLVSSMSESNPVKADVGWLGVLTHALSHNEVGTLVKIDQNNQLTYIKMVP